MWLICPRPWPGVCVLVRCGGTGPCYTPFSKQDTTAKGCRLEGYIPGPSEEAEWPAGQAVSSLF